MGQQQTFSARHGLIGQYCNRYYFHHEVGVRKRSTQLAQRVEGYCNCSVLGNAEQRIVHYVLPEVGRTQYAPSGKWFFHKKSKPDQVTNEVPSSSKSDLIFVSMLRHCAPRLLRHHHPC